MTETRSGKDAATGNKHKLDEPASPPAAKAPKKEEQAGKKQLTLDESLNGNTREKEPKKATQESQADAEDDHEEDDHGDEKDDHENEKEATNQAQNSDQNDQPIDQTESSGTHESAIEPHGRNGSSPSTILEKGIIYFFFRGRVGIDHPSKVDDLARSYMILRPIPTDAKLGEGPIGDAGNSRLVAIPKKVLPQSGRDRWIAFVEKSNTSFDKLKEEFLAANDYETKTAGTRHSPAATPFGEGVYAITATGRESHLAYLLTLPEKLGEVQNKIGLKEKGSWILSTRNPQYPAPSNTALPEGPEFSKEASDSMSLILDEFRSLRWMGTLPKHLIPNAQFLLVGESSGLEKAMEPDEKDEKAEEKTDPMEEMEQLEDEDAERMENLGQDASESIFADLQASAKDYPKLQTTF